MTRSPKDDPRYSDMQHNAWNYRAETSENCTPGVLNERNQVPLSSNTAAMNDNSMYANGDFANDVYLNKHPYNMQAADTGVSQEENISLNNMPNAARVNRQNYGNANAMLKLANGQVVRFFYDENTQQLYFPMSGQYELFNNNQGLRDMPLPAPQQPPMFNPNQEYSMNNNNIQMQTPTSTTQNNYIQENLNNQTNTMPTSNFLKEVLGNWEPNSSGTYSPFGQNYPLNHPDVPPNVLPKKPMDSPINQIKAENSPKRNENSPLADTSNKKRIVAEVKPMRPTYSDVLAKNTKNNTQPDVTKAKLQSNIEIKTASNKSSSKPDKASNLKHADENKQKERKQHANTISSGSESGDINNEDMVKRQKPSKKSKNKRNNISRKWSSLDDVTNEEDVSYTQGNESQFVFIENQEKPKKDKKVNDRSKNLDKNTAVDDDSKDDEDQSQFVFQDNQNDSAKARKKKEARIYHKISKPVQDKKKTTQIKFKRNKPGYLGVAQNYLEHWGEATWKAIVWFFYLLSDICRMSAHLTFDLCTSMFTQTYVSSQAVWRSSKEWLYKVGGNKYLVYIDRKFGHTRFGFWRKLKWFKKEAEVDNGSDSSKLNSNIPLPATGEEAMKRLLACKGKDPYRFTFATLNNVGCDDIFEPQKTNDQEPISPEQLTFGNLNNVGDDDIAEAQDTNNQESVAPELILGVSVSCTDEEIKRYYRRQAFLVHPDKNQQPGAEEAFKILQHAFDLIGEPERREAYERRALESRHVEAAWGELSQLLAQLQDKMEFAHNTIRCTNCGRRHKRVLTDRPCYAARYCVQCKIRHSAKEGDIWAESSMMGLLVMYYACMDGAVYQITQWASCQKKNLKQLRPDCHVVQYRIVLGNKAAAASDLNQRPSTGHDPNLEEFLNNLYSKSGVSPNTAAKQPSPETTDAKKRRNKKPKA